MSYLRTIVVAGTCIVSAVGVTAASAEPTVLICQFAGPSLISVDGPLTIELDELRGTVTVHSPASRLADGSGGGQQAHTLGPLAATFTDQEITFHYAGVSDVSVINRLTGRFEEAPNSAWVWTCQAGRKQF